MPSKAWYMTYLFNKTTHIVTEIYFLIVEIIKKPFKKQLNKQ